MGKSCTPVAAKLFYAFIHERKIQQPESGCFFLFWSSSHRMTAFDAQQETVNGR